jgi:hypothetical protein
MPSTTANVYQAEVTFTGTIGLVLDNIDTADPENLIAVEIKKITDKGSDMTSEDRKRKDWLAYQGAFYKDATGNLVIPWRSIKRALRSGAYLVGGTSLSGKIDAGIEPGVTAVEFPLSYKGPTDTIALYEDKKYCLRLMVNKNPSGKKAMIPSVRPILPQWSLAFPVTVFNEIIGWDRFVRSVEFTGKSVGIGNARKLGYGRFAVDIKQT